MKLKTIEVDGKTYAIVQDGKPVYEDDGKDIAFDAPGTRETIRRINGEAKQHREAKEAAEEKLKAFEGITDPAAAIKALDTVKNIDDKKLIDAGRVEEVKREVAKSFEDKIKSLETSHATALQTERAEKDTMRTAWHTEKLSNAFSTSKAISEKFAIPADLVQSRFGQNFKIEDGALVGYDNAGNKIYSRARPAELANFDEAIETLVDQYPYKEQILKGMGGGSGSKGGSGGGANGKQIKRSEFDKLAGADQMAKIREGVQVVD